MNKKLVILEILVAFMGAILFGFIFLTVGANIGGNLPIGYEIPGMYGLYLGVGIGGMLGAYVVRQAKPQSSQKISTAVFIGLLVGAIICGYFIISTFRNNQDTLHYNAGAKAIESMYPEISSPISCPDECMQNVNYKKEGSDYYIAYVNYGNGSFVIRAYCFKFDKNSVLTKVGEFPDMADSYAGYKDVDALTCKGIK